jgi:hypothetical protein
MKKGYTHELRYALQIIISFLGEGVMWFEALYRV